MVSTVSGGVASVAGGGKFGNGAVTAAFGYLYNSMALCMRSDMPCTGAEMAAELAGGRGGPGARASTSHAALNSGVNQRSWLEQIYDGVFGRPISVTKDGVALPSAPKYEIPSEYVQSPYRNGSYGEIANGKYVERLRIDPPTAPGTKGPNYSHYHLDGRGTHYSPRSGMSDPGFSR